MRTLAFDMRSQHIAENMRLEQKRRLTQFGRNAAPLGASAGMGSPSQRLRSRRSAITVALTASVGAALVVLTTGCGGQLPKPTTLAAGIGYQGIWDTNWGQLELRQQGTRVRGRYSGFRNGSVAGDARGDVLVFRWTQTESRQFGRGFFKMSPDGRRMEGRWGYQKDYGEGGRWWATRAD